MPYVITTKRADDDDRNCNCNVPALDGAGQHHPGCACFKAWVVSRRAVATLEEAGEKFHEHLYSLDMKPQGALGKEWQWWADAWRECISESGGTVGPLPDGTVIEVRHIGWQTLADLMHESYRCPSSDEDRATRIAAYNAAQEAVV